MAIDIKDVILRINKLTSKEKVHIFNILKNSETDFSKNVNGYFFNLSNVDEGIIYKIIDCLELIEKNRDKIKDLDRRREEMIAYYKGMIEDKLKISLKERKNNYIKKLLICEQENNVIMTINRKNRIKKRVWGWQSKQDPDEMIKEYNKMMKYEKDTVYYRLLTKSKTVSKNAAALNAENEESNNNIIIDDNDNENIDEIYDEYNDNENENYDEYDEFYKNDDEIEKNSIDEKDVDIDVDVDEDEKETEIVKRTKYTNEEIVEEQNEETTEYNISYYKKLLNKHGFKFDEYKNHRLYFEEYIK